MKISYYGVDAATKKLWFFGLDGDIYTGILDEETSSWQLDPYSQNLPVVVFPNTYRILDSTDSEVLYQWEGKNYIASSQFQKYGANSYLWSVANVKETNLSALPSTKSEDDLAKMTSHPLVPILLIAAAYWIFIK